MARLVAEFDQALAEKDEVMAEAERCQRKLDMAQRPGDSQYYQVSKDCYMTYMIIRISSHIIKTFVDLHGLFLHLPDLSRHKEIHESVICPDLANGKPLNFWGSHIFSRRK